MITANYPDEDNQLPEPPKLSRMINAAKCLNVDSKMPPDTHTFWTMTHRHILPLKLTHAENSPTSHFEHHHATTTTLKQEKVHLLYTFYVTVIC